MEKKKRNQFIYTTYFSNVIYAMRSFVGDTISGTGMADMHRKARISDLCIYDCGRMLLYFECKKIYAATFFICCNFRNTIQLDYGKFCNLPVSSKRTVDISVRSVINTDYWKSKKETKAVDTASYNLSCSFHGLSAWNHIHGRLQCSGNTDSIAFLLFPKKDMGFFCGTICRNVLFKCSYAWRSVLSGNYSWTSFWDSTAEFCITGTYSNLVI